MKKLFLMLSVLLLVLALALFLPVAAGNGVQLQTDIAQPSLISAVNTNHPVPFLAREVSPKNNFALVKLFAILTGALLAGILAITARKLYSTWKRAFHANTLGAGDRRTILNYPIAAG